MLEDRRFEPPTEYTHCNNCDCVIDDESSFVLSDITLCRDCAMDIDYFIAHINQNSKIEGYQVVEMLEVIKKGL